MFVLDLAVLHHVNMTGKVREGVGWSHDGRRMTTNMLVVFQHGACQFCINDKVYEFQRGDIAMIPRGVYYKPHTDYSAEYTFFHFDGELLPYQSQQNGSDNDDKAIKNPLYGKMAQMDTQLLFDYKMSLENDLPEIEILLNRCVNTQYSSKVNYQLLLSIQFSELLFQVSRAYSEQVNQTSALPMSLNKILLYIQENYTHTITLEDVELCAGFSKQYCMRLFKTHMHMTINDYILDLRMRHAAYLLRDTYMNVNQAADYLGFSSVSYFSRAFKHYFGVSPSKYKV